MTETVSGHCLCGAVTLRVELGGHGVIACHCHQCRTWGGGPLLVLDSTRRVDFHGQEAITTYPSSTWAERGFCRYGGTHLFYRSTAMPSRWD